MLNEDDVNMSGTGNIDGRLLPANERCLQMQLRWNAINFQNKPLR